MEERTVDGYAAIYALSDPRDESIRYVGRTVDLQARYWSHVQNPLPSIARWCNELAITGHVPVMLVLKIVDKSQWVEAETRNIQRRVNLLNVNKGGEGAEPSRPRTFDEVEQSCGSCPWIRDTRPDRVERPKLPFDAVNMLCKLRACKSFRGNASAAINNSFAALQPDQQDAFAMFVLNIIEDNKNTCVSEGAGVTD